MTPDQDPNIAPDLAMDSVTLLAIGERWLVRTAQNKILGPMARDKAQALVQSGELKPEDEICAANSYWIFLHEREEVKKQLGVDGLSWGIGESDEMTQTQTESDLEKTDPSIIERPVGSPSALSQGNTKAGETSPALPVRHPKTGTFGSIERGSFWSTVLWLAVFFFAIGVIVLIRFTYGSAV